MEREKLIEAAKIFYKERGHLTLPEVMAEFAASVIQDLGVYREICERASIIELPKYTIFRVSAESGYEVQGDDDQVWKFNTLQQAFEFVKGGGGEKDGNA